MPDLNPPANARSAKDLWYLILPALAFLALQLIGMAAAQDQPQDRRARMKAIRQACSVDRQKFCGSIQPGGGRILECLRSHGPELTPACQQALPQPGGAAPPGPPPTSPQ